MPCPSFWHPFPGEGHRQVSYLCKFSFVPNSLFPGIVVKVHEDTTVDKSPPPRFFCNRAIFQTRATPDACDVCEGSPSKPQQKYHRVHIELSYPRNALVVTVRGPKPCCVVNSTCKMIKSVAGENVVMRIDPLCPECVVGEPSSEASRLNTHPGQPAADIACDVGHELGTQRDVLMGKLRPKHPKSLLGDNSPLEDKDCPRLFMMLPINKDTSVFSRLVPYSLLRDGFAVHFLCEHPDQRHFLSTPGFRLNRLQKFINTYGGRVYKLLDVILKTDIWKTQLDPDERDCDDALSRLRRLYDNKFPKMKEEAELVNLFEPDDNEMLRRNTLKKLLGISRDDDQPHFPDLTYVKIKGKILWLCNKHAKACMPEWERERNAATNQSSRQSLGMSIALSQTEKEEKSKELSRSPPLGTTAKSVRCFKGSPSITEINDLSVEIVGNWDFLARRLGVEETQIERVRSDNVQFPGIRQKAFQVLKIWRDTGEASYTQLAEALESEGLGRLAEQYHDKEVCQGNDDALGSDEIQATSLTSNGRAHETEDDNGGHRASQEDSSCEEYSDEKPADHVLAALSEDIIPVWQSLGRRLGLADGTIDGIAFSLTDLEPKQQAFRMLMDWCTQSPGSGSGHLAEALKAEGLGSLVEKYCLKQEVQGKRQTEHLMPEGGAVVNTSQPSYKELDELSVKICPVWQRLGTALLVDQNALECINSNNIEWPKPEQKAFQMLKRWIHMGRSSTYSQLRDALMHIERRDLAESFCVQ